MTSINPAANGIERFDVAVIGGGIVGLASAMALASDYSASVIVVEAEGELAAHQTGNNSGVIHSGLYYKPGSLKARLCTEGRRALVRFCEERNIPFELCGKVVVAINEAELPALDELQRRGTANGLANLKRLSIEEIREVEPHVAGIAGLVVKETGIVNYKRVAQEYATFRRAVEEWAKVREEWVADRKQRLLQRWEETSFRLRLEQIEQGLRMQRRRLRAMSKAYA